MASDVPAREGLTLTPGDWGFKGSGGGALSGSELSHLYVIVSRVPGRMIDWGWLA